MFAWHSFFHHYTFNFSVSIMFYMCLCIWRIVRFFKKIQSDNPYVLIGVFRPFISNVIMHIFGFKTTIYCAFSLSYLFCITLYLLSCIFIKKILLSHFSSIFFLFFQWLFQRLTYTLDLNSNISWLFTLFPDDAEALEVFLLQFMLFSLRCYCFFVFYLCTFLTPQDIVIIILTFPYFPFLGLFIPPSISNLHLRSFSQEHSLLFPLVRSKFSSFFFG